MILGFIPLFILAIWGPQIINFLYPKNYHEAGWMLKILAISFSFKSITATLSPFLFAVGNSFKAMIVILSGACVMIICMIVGGHFYGPKGIIWALPLGEFLTYPILVVTLLPYRIWMPWLDFIGFSLTIGVLLYSQHLS